MRLVPDHTSETESLTTVVTAYMQLERQQLSDCPFIHIHVVARLAVTPHYQLAASLPLVCYH